MSRPLVITFAPPSNAPSAPAKQVLLAPAVPLAPSPLVEAWTRTVASWSDGKLHDTVLGIAAKHEQLAWLAARYREIATARPDDPVALARLARLQRAALVTMLADKPHEPKTRTPYRGAAILLAVAVLAIVVGLWLVDMQSRGFPPHAKPAAASR